MPPLCKGGCRVSDGGIVYNAADLQILLNDSKTIPHPLRGSSLYTREPYEICASRELPLPGGSLFCFDSATVPFDGGKLLIWVITEPDPLGATQRIP